MTLIAQSPFELDMLTRLFRDLKPERALEIGVWHGGTLHRWLQACPDVVAIDAQMLYPDMWGRWAEEAGANLTLLHGSSADPAIIAAARRRGPYGFVMVDAGHTYSEVQQDWLNYRPMVAEGGVMVFHDIQPRPDYGVSQLWDEIKNETGARTSEFFHKGGSFYSDGLTSGYDPGIGVVWL